MNKLNNFFYLIPAYIFALNSQLCAFESHNEIKINSNLKLDVFLSGEAVRGGKINVKVFALSNVLKNLKDINLSLLINRGVFRFIKKYFDSDFFKVKTEKLDDNIMIIEFTLKNKKELSFSENAEIKLLDFDLNIKKKIEEDESDLIFKFDIENTEKEFLNHISMSSKIINIESEILDINFDENNKFYKMSVPYDEQYVDFKISKLIDGKEEFESKRTKLKKAGTTTIIKIGDYEFEICRLENEKIQKKKETNADNMKAEKSKVALNSKKESKRKKNKPSNKSKDKLSKKSSKKTKKDRIQEVCYDSDEEESDKDFEIEDQSVTKVKEEKIENKENDDKIKWAVGCSGLLLSLIVLFISLKRKYKNKK